MDYFVGYIGNNIRLLKKWEKGLCNFFDSSYSSLHFDIGRNVKVIEYNNRILNKNNKNFYINGYLNYKNNNDLQHLGRNSTQIDLSKLDKFVFSHDRIINYDGNFTLVYQNGENVILTNDYYGTIPCYLYQCGNDLFFCSDIKLFFFIIDDIKIDYKSVEEWLLQPRCLSQNVIAKGNTLFKNIKKVENGNIIVFHVKKNKIEYHKYNYVNYRVLSKLKYQNVDFEKHYCESLNILTNEFQKLLIENLKKKQEEFGERTLLSLSGGIDSAVLLQNIDKINDIKKTYCINFSINTKNARCDDEEIVKKLSEQLGNECIFVKNVGGLKLNSIETNDILTTLDNLNFYNNSGFHVNIENCLIQKNIDYNLNGDGGDYLFNGISYSVDFFIRKKKFKLAYMAYKSYIDRKHIKNTLFNKFKYILGPFIPIYNNKLYYKMFWEERLKTFYQDKRLVRKYIKYQKKNMRKSSVFKDFSKRYIMDFIIPKGDYYDSTFINGRILRPLMDIEMLKYVISVPNIFSNKNYQCNKEFENCKMILKNCLSYDGLLKEIDHKTNYGSILREVLINSSDAIKKLCKENWCIASVKSLNIEKIKRKIELLLCQVKDNQFIPNENTMYLIKVLNMELFLRVFSNKKKFLELLSVKNVENDNIIEVLNEIKW